MTNEEQLIQMRWMILGNAEDNSKDAIFNIMLNNAKAIILNTLFPFDSKAVLDETNFRLRNWQVRCAIELYSAVDREGIQSYSENGFSVSYLASKISTSLMGELVPKAGCPIVKETAEEVVEEIIDEPVVEVEEEGENND